MINSFGKISTYNYNKFLANLGEEGHSFNLLNNSYRNLITNLLARYGKYSL